MPTETKSDMATARPWRYSASTRTIYAGRGFTIANIPNSSETATADVEIEANIELLIKAVNEHAALIAVAEAAEGFADYIDGFYGGDLPPTARKYLGTLGTALAALARRR